MTAWEWTLTDDVLVAEHEARLEALIRCRAARHPDSRIQYRIENELWDSLHLTYVCLEQRHGLSVTRKINRDLAAGIEARLGVTDKLARLL